MLTPGKTDVVLLCGGFGTRLKTVVHDRPKPMAEINDRPFLDILIDYVSDYGFKRFILCTGHKGDVIRKYYEAKNTQKIFLFSEEKEPLGTGGAIKNAEPLIQSDVFMVMNGDSFCNLDLCNFLNYHDSTKAYASIALAKKEKSLDCGVVRMDGHGRITVFHEKVEAGDKSYVNAGVYLFNKEVFSLLPSHKNFSLELNLFPSLIQKKAVYGFFTHPQLIDIGTPERYELAKKIFKSAT